MNTNTILFSVREILAEVYSDSIEEAMTKLYQYKLVNIIDSKLGFLRSKVEQNDRIDLNVFSTSLLKSINDIVLNIQNDLDKKFLKYVLSEIGTYLIDSFLVRQQLNKTQLTRLFDSLKDLSEIEGYDFRDLEMRLQLRRSIRNQINGIIDSSQTAQIVYYQWMGEDYKLIELANNLKSEKAILSVKDFKKLFSPNPRKILFSENSKKFILVLVDLLYEHKMIKPRKTKGHLLPLKNYAVDLDNKLLFQNKMKVEKQIIKKNSTKYNVLRAKAKNWIS